MVYILAYNNTKIIFLQNYKKHTISLSQIYWNEWSHKLQKIMYINMESGLTWPVDWPNGSVVSSPSRFCSLEFSSITHLIFLVHLLSQQASSRGILSHVSLPPWPSSSPLVPPLPPISSASPFSPTSDWSSQWWTLRIQVNFEDWLGKVGHKEEWLYGH
jgi:hypothetical protein